MCVVCKDIESISPFDCEMMVDKQKGRFFIFFFVGNFFFSQGAAAVQPPAPDEIIHWPFFFNDGSDLLFIYLEGRLFNFLEFNFFFLRQKFRVR